MSPTPISPPVRRQAVALCLFALLTVLLCAALVTAAVLLHPPLVVVPVIVMVGIGCPLAVGYELPRALAALRAAPATRRARGGAPGHAVAALRRDLDLIPETRHPLGL